MTITSFCIAILFQHSLRFFSHKFLLYILRFGWCFLLSRIKGEPRFRILKPAFFSGMFLIRLNHVCVWSVATWSLFLGLYIFIPTTSLKSLHEKMSFGCSLVGSQCQSVEPHCSAKYLYLPIWIIGISSNRSISTVTINHETLVKCKKYQIKMLTVA